MSDEISLDELIMSLIVSCLRESEDFQKYELKLIFKARVDKDGNIEAEDFEIQDGVESIKPLAVKPDITH